MVTTGRTGIYFLFVRKKLIYIGQTSHWPSRLASHKIKFDSARFIDCDWGKRREYEHRLILIFRPSENFRLKDTPLMPKLMIPEIDLYSIAIKKIRKYWIKIHATEIDLAIKNKDMGLSISLARAARLTFSCVRKMNDLEMWTQIEKIYLNGHWRHGNKRH